MNFHHKLNVFQDYFFQEKNVWDFDRTLKTQRLPENFQTTFVC
jgi:hypothetical protein